jgi:hypothetical protein
MPLLFETMVFRGKEIVGNRGLYPTWAMAEAGHRRAVLWLRNTAKADDSGAALSRVVSFGERPASLPGSTSSSSSTSSGRPPRMALGCQTWCRRMDFVRVEAGER